jgi:hypothetical protein
MIGIALSAHRLGFGRDWGSRDSILDRDIDFSFRRSIQTGLDLCFSKRNPFFFPGVRTAVLRS